MGFARIGMREQIRWCCPSMVQSARQIRTFRFFFLIEQLQQKKISDIWKSAIIGDAQQLNQPAESNLRSNSKLSKNVHLANVTK